VVVASQRPEELLKTPRSVEALGLGDLRERAPRSTPELLEGVPGVVVQKTAHGGGSPYVRGFTGQHVLQMLDGVRLNNGTTRYGPNQLLNTVDPFSLRRVELLRGPGSLYYGSDAMGGVIYLLGRDAPYQPGARYRAGGEASARWSSADSSQSYNLGAFAQLHMVTLFAGGSFKDFGALSGGRGIGPQAWTGYQEGSWDAALNAHLGSDWSIKVATNGIRQDDVPRTDKCSPGDFRYFRNQDRDLAYAKLSGRHGRLLDRLELTLSYQRQAEDRDRYRISRDRIERESDRVQTLGVSLVAGTNLGRASVLSYGGDLYLDRVSSWQRRESISSGELLGDSPADRRGRFVEGSSYLQGGLFLADAFRPRRWLRIQTGGRLAFAKADIPTDPLASSFGLPGGPVSDANLGFGGGLSFTFIPWRQLHLVVSAHHAFRAPNLDDYSHLGSEGGGFDIPSPKLRPEQATTLEAGLKCARRWLRLSVFGYYSWLSDFITRRLTGALVDGEPATERVNAGRGYTAGLEGSLQILFPRGFELTAWLSYSRGDLVSPMDSPASQPISRMSPLQGLVSLAYRSNRGHFAQAGLRWSARQDRLAPQDLLDPRICPQGPDRCDGTPGFAVITLSAGLRLGPYLHATVRIENLTNEPYKHHGSGVWAPGLSAVGLLQVKYR
jgi:outer membrane receptor protein involved in Fe transport